MQLQQLQVSQQQQQQEVYEQGLPKYEDICSGCEDNNKVVQVFVISPEEHQQPQQQSNTSGSHTYISLPEVRQQQLSSQGQHLLNRNQQQQLSQGQNLHRKHQATAV